MKPVISFLICTRNRADIVYRCVSHLLSITRKDIEIVVRDNCSTDHTIQFLREIDDSRVRIYSAPENQSTVNFYEISKLAMGDVITWLSDEDNFQLDQLDHVLRTFERNPGCDVVLGSITVGQAARQVIYRDELITNPIKANVTALSFSGCGGVFVRRSALPKANSFQVRSLDDAYFLWNYYPVGFFASCCVDRSLVTLSRVVVVQCRFAPTTNNWSKTPLSGQARDPHYYPESTLDRLVSNIVNIYLKSYPAWVKFAIVLRLIYIFVASVRSFSNRDVIKLLNENYSSEVVDIYSEHINDLGVAKAIGRYRWLVGSLLRIPRKVRITLSRWRELTI